jgi:hypothetical protein
LPIATDGGTQSDFGMVMNWGRLALSALLVLGSGVSFAVEGVPDGLDAGRLADLMLTEAVKAPRSLVISFSATPFTVMLFSVVKSRCLACSIRIVAI